MTPDEAKAAMSEIYRPRLVGEMLPHGYCEESAHLEADDLMCGILRSLGYGEAVEIFESAHKWYA